MTDSSQTPSIVLIDDDAVLLERLAENLKCALTSDSVEIRSWVPTEGEDPFAEFKSRIDSSTVLVVTDYDLTKNGVTGLFGVSIVSWCLQKGIPVGDFSRANVSSLPSEPSMFELRVPTDLTAGTEYVVAMFRGFSELRDALTGDPSLLAMRSPAGVLARVLDRPALEGQLALYMSRLGAANSSLMDRLRGASTGEATTDDAEKDRLLTYVLGHVLVNAVLRYPGPILSAEALCAYLSTTEAEATAVEPVFADARYGGPFGSNQAYYWRSTVDEIIEQESTSLVGEEFSTSGEFNRAVVEQMLGRTLAVHGCERCGGRRGGYLCPFTHRPVCERSDCSVAANSWIPSGADVCRIERDFYDEWAPLLGL